MNRDTRAALGQQTVRIVEDGQYTLPDGRRVELRSAVEACVRKTSLWTPDVLDALIRQPASKRHAVDTEVEVVEETSLAGARRLVGEGAASVAVLNFASARNPGGGFLGGSQAQEESLARSSALYASLTSRAATPYYEHHRQERSALYSDHMVFSPACPVFRDDDGQLLQHLVLVDFITSAAPNAGALANNHPADLPRVPEVFAARICKMLALAAHQGCTHLVLGAWGCGVFRNDPETVARLFAEALTPDGVLRKSFRRVCFSIRDSSPGQPVLAAFRAALLPVGAKP
jgi:uncharacterized protein (TIGR02452 family)